MGPIDRLGWAGGFSLKPTALTLNIRCNQDWMLRRIRREVLLPDWQLGELGSTHLFSFFVGGEARPGLRNFTLLFDGSARLARTMDVEAGYRTLRQALYQRVAASAEELYVRGQTLSWEGRAVLILDAPEGWLSESVPSLRHYGVSLLSSDYAVIDSHGRVRPFANAHGTTLGLGLESQSLPLGRIVVTGKVPGPLSGARVVWHLFRNLQRRHASEKAVQELASAVRAGNARGVEVTDSQAILVSLFGVV